VGDFLALFEADDFFDVLPADVAVRAALNPLWRVDRVQRVFFKLCAKLANGKLRLFDAGRDAGSALDTLSQGTGREHSYKPGGAGCLFDALCDSKTGYLISAVSRAHGNRVKDLMADAIEVDQ